MTDDLGFQRTARDWLELGPVEAPADVIQAALLEIDTTPQERDLRVPWTVRPLPTLARALVAAAVIVALVAGGAIILQRTTREQIGGPSPLPTTAPSAVGLGATDLSSTFVSDRYGYTLPINPAWTTQQASLTWTGPDNSTPVIDELSIPGTGLGFNAASEPLAPGQTLDEWLATFQPPSIASQACFGGSPSEWPTRQIGDRAWRWQQGCSAATAITEDSGRAWVFTCVGCKPTVDDVDQLFDRMLVSVQLHSASIPSPAPAAALDGDYQSDQHGFALNYPGSWTVLQRASAPGPATRVPAPGDASLDALGDATQRLSVTSLQLPAGQTADDWARAFCGFTRTQWSLPCDQAPGVWEQVPLANGIAWLAVNGDSAARYPQPDSRLFLATAVSGDRIYEIRLEGPAERDLFLAILASMRLDPAAAVAGTSPP